MSLNRWKVLACTLTVGIGGLAVFATDTTPKTDAPKEPDPLPKLTAKPDTPPSGTDTPAPVAPVKGDEIELTLPVPPPPAAKAEENSKPSTVPVFEPVAPPTVPTIIIPASGESEPNDVKKPEPAKKDAEPPSIKVPVPPKSDDKVPASPVVPEPTKPEASKLPMIEVPLPDLKKPPVDPVAPPPPVKVTPVPPTTSSVPTVTVPGPKPDVPPVVLTPMPTPPEAVKVPLATPSNKPAEGTKLKLLLRMGDGQPRFEIRNTATTELLMKVYGEKIEMQAPPDARSSLAGVTAIGRVRFTAPGIEGTCDHLSILSATGEVLLKGNIHLKTKRGKTWSEMTAEKMVYQIGTTGLATQTTSKVTPASYIPD